MKLTAVLFIKKTFKVKGVDGGNEVWEAAYFEGIIF